MKKNSQRGEVVIEASIVVTVVVLFLAVVFYVGMLLYQQTALTTVANKTASNIAMLYSNNQKDPFTGYINSDGVYQNITYSDLKTETYLQELEKKATAFASYSLKSSDMLNTGKPKVTIEIVDKKGEVLKNQVVVTITNEFKAPLVGIFSDDTTMKCTAVGRADCVDILDYINGVDAISNPEESNVLTFPKIDSCVVTFLDNPDTNNVVAVVPVLKGHSISSAESIKEAHSFWPDNPKIKGIAFNGWVNSATNASFDRNTIVNTDVTVYGAWNCTITFKPNGGNGSDIKKTVAYGKTVTFPNIERNGYKIAGWYANAEGTGDRYYSGVTQFRTSCTLYPKWECIHLTMNKTLKTAGTCQKKSVWTYKCTTCPYTYEKNGDYGVCALGEYSVTSEASCTTTGNTIGKCKYCFRTMADYTKTIPALGHRYASNGKDYDQTYTRAATCQVTGLIGSKCSRCGTEKGKVLPLTGHSWNAKCNIDHDVSRNPIKITSHNKQAGYTGSTVVRCYLCEYCATPYGGWRTTKDKNGLKISQGVICGKHNDNNGYNMIDQKYYSNKTINIH